MKYFLKEIEDKESWNDYIIKWDFEFYSFLVSWEWWEFQELASKRVYRLGIFEWEKQIGVIPLIVNKAKRGTYLFAPHAPLIEKDYDYFEVLTMVLSKLKELAKKEGASFIRFNTPIKNKIENKRAFKKLWFWDAPMHEHAEDTHLLLLDKTEEELLANIKKEDRYYINRAIKEWVEIKKSNDKELREILTLMHQEHSKKIWYHAFSPLFIENLYRVFGDKIITISASYNNKVESILMTIRFGKTCVYYIAASDIVSHKFSPNYLCQWEAIKDAKEKWALIYNFWGVSPDDNKKHPIAWVTKFKRKFAWYDYSLLHAQDLPLRFSYVFNYVLETIRRIKRWYYYKKPE